MNGKAGRVRKNPPNRKGQRHPDDEKPRYKVVKGKKMKLPSTAKS